MNDVTKEVLRALAEIRAVAERRPADGWTRPRPGVLHARMRAFAERAMTRAAELGFPPRDVQDIGFALVALIDETVMAAGGELREHWLSCSLQLQLFNTNIAGQEFFRRLHDIRQTPGRLEALKAYYLCLLFGFRGQYRVRGREVELQRVVDDVSQALHQGGLLRDAPLSPHGARPADRSGGAGRDMPVVWIGAAAVLAALLLYAGMFISVAVTADALVEHIEQRTASLRGAAP